MTEFRFRLVTAISLALAITILFAHPVSADFSGSTWRSLKPILLPSGWTEESLIEVVPDLQVFEHANRGTLPPGNAAGLSDVRIVDTDSLREVPFKLLVERGEQRRGSIEVALRDLGHVPDLHTSFIADLQREGVLHNELEIRTPSRNFQRRVVIEGSADRESWAVLQNDGQIFDFTIAELDFSTRDTRVRYPSSTARYLRVIIINDDEPPLEVTGAVAFFAQGLAPRQTELEATISAREEDPEAQQSFVFFDLGSHGFPSHQLSIVTTQQNLYRRVRLDGSSDGERWVPVQSSDALYSYDTPNFVGSKLSITHSESTYRYYRLTIFNEDNPPLPIDGATASGFLRKLIFSAAPGREYSLYYGNAEARAPSYELERTFRYLVTENLPEAQLGMHTANPLFVEPGEPVKPFTERYPWLLPTAMVIASLLIGLFLANLLREVRKLLPPPPSAP